jgi:hypothetical protein
MAIVPEKDRPRVFDAHRLDMIRLAREVNARAGVTDEPSLTAEELQEQMRARGVRAEDNLLSSETIHMRYGEDADEE